MGRVPLEVEDLLQLGSRRMANIHTTRLLTHPRTLHFDSLALGQPLSHFRLGGDLLDLPVRPAQASPFPTAAPSAFGTSVLNFKIGSILGSLSSRAS
jgi:hypothetical protein